MLGEAAKHWVSEKERRRQEQECQRVAGATSFQRWEERREALLLDNRSVSLVPARGALPSRMGGILEHNLGDSFDLENLVEHESPHVPGHLVSKTYASSRSQHVQPHHMAARVDSRLAMRLIQSAPIMPEKERELVTICSLELTCSLEDPHGYSVGVGSTRPYHMPTHCRNEKYYGDYDISLTTRYTSMGVKHETFPSLDNIRRPLSLSPKEENSKFASRQVERETKWESYPAGPSPLKGPQSPFTLKRSTRTVESESVQAQGLLNTIPNIGKRTVSSRERSSPLPASPTTDEFTRETRNWNHESSLMSPPYLKDRVVPPTKLTHQLVDLLKINQCTRFELKQAMRHYIRLIDGREPEMKDDFWVLAAYFRKRLMQRPSQLPDGINNNIFHLKEEYEGALWLVQLLADPD